MALLTELDRSPAAAIKSAKRLEYARLADAFVGVGALGAADDFGLLPAVESGSKLLALHTLRAIRPPWPNWLLSH